MKSFGLASFKGGVGKTMVAYSLAERATSSGLRVMLLDFDPTRVRYPWSRCVTPDCPGGM